MTQCCTLHSPPAASCSTHTILATRAAHHRTAAASTPDGMPDGFPSCKLYLARCNLASCRLHRASCILQVASCRLLLARCMRYVGEQREFSQPRDDLAWPRSELARHAQVDQVCTHSAHMATWNTVPDGIRRPRVLGHRQVRCERGLSGNGPKWAGLSGNGPK
jgi:hypothetical protein